MNLAELFNKDFNFTKKNNFFKYLKKLIPNNY